MPALAYEVAAAPIVLPLLLVGLLVVIVALQRRALLTPPRLLTVLVVAGYLTALGAATMFPLQADVGPLAPPPVPWADSINLVPLVTADPGGFVLNIAMTIPLGLLAPLVLRVRSVAAAALVGFVVSTAIELLQLAGNIAFATGRTTDINDVISNTLGTVFGWLLLRRLSRVRWSRRPLQAMALHRLRRPSVTTHTAW